MLRENVVDISHIRVSGFEKIYVCPSSVTRVSKLLKINT